MKYALAINIGASLGRHILGWIGVGKLYTEEYTGKNVAVGAVETTTLGNIISQFYTKDGEYTLDKLRGIISNSF